jgi:hypothetical protein
MAVDAHDDIALFEILSSWAARINAGNHNAMHVSGYSELLTNRRREALHGDGSQRAFRRTPFATGCVSEIGGPRVQCDLHGEGFSVAENLESNRRSGTRAGRHCEQGSR